MLELKTNEKRETSLRTILAFTFVMDLVLYQIIYPREQNKENNGDIQYEKTKWNSPSISSCSSPSPKARIIIFHIFGISFLVNKIYFHWVSRQPNRGTMKYTEIHNRKRNRKKLRWSVFLYKFSLAIPMFSRQANKENELGCTQIRI